MCGHAPVVTQGIRRLRPGGAAVLVGCVTPDTALSLTGDMMVRGCVTMIGIHNYHQLDLTTAVQVSPDNILNYKRLCPSVRLSVTSFHHF